MHRAILGASLFFFSTCAAFGQSVGSPAFDVASVKPAEPPAQMGMMRVRMSGGPGTPDPGQLTYTNVTLKNVLMNAYGVKGYQISGPKWLESERFDIVAKIPTGTTKEDFKLMLQNLLAERFKLTLHHETKELPMYSLVVGKGGSKLKEVVDETPAPGATPPSGAATASGPSASGPSAFAPPPPPPPSGGGSGSFGGSFGAGGGAAPVRLSMGADGTPKMPAGMMPKGGLMVMMMNGRLRMAGSGSISQLTEMLTNQLGRPVEDHTDLKAKYDLTLDFAPENNGGPMGMMMAPPPGHDGAPGGGAPMAAAPENAGPSIHTALQEQMGLKLEQKKGPVDLLVIDRLEKTPTEN